MVVKKLVIILLFLIGLIFFLTRYQAGTQKSLENPAPAIQNQSEEKSAVSSPDGSMKLQMTKKELNGSTVYSFSVLNKSGSSFSLFEKKTTLGESMAIPPNSWSPNNKYLFIDDRNGYLIDYLVFKANKEPFTNGDTFLNATALFNQKVKNYNLKEITGWDDPVLMSVRTVDGPHFWFDITTQSFIQLVK